MWELDEEEARDDSGFVPVRRASGFGNCRNGSQAGSGLGLYSLTRGLCSGSEHEPLRSSKPEGRQFWPNPFFCSIHSRIGFSCRPPGRWICGMHSRLLQATTTVTVFAVCPPTVITRLTSPDPARMLGT